MNIIRRRFSFHRRTLYYHTIIRKYLPNTIFITFRVVVVKRRRTVFVSFHKRQLSFLPSADVFLIDVCFECDIAFIATRITRAIYAAFVNESASCRCMLYCISNNAHWMRREDLVEIKRTFRYKIYCYLCVTRANLWYWISYTRREFLGVFFFFYVRTLCTKKSAKQRVSS